MGRQHGVQREAVLDGKMTVCKCPKCLGEHLVYMNWQGRGTPRKFCTSCKFNLDQRGFDLTLVEHSTPERDSYIQPSLMTMTPTLGNQRRP